MSEEEIREWIKRNVVITTRDAGYGTNSIIVGLRIVDEQEPFTEDLISIPDSPS